MTHALYRLTPLALACAVTAALTGCGSNGGASPAASGSTPASSELSFINIDPATADIEKTMVRTSPSITVNGATMPVSYIQLARSGEVHGDNPDTSTYGQIVDDHLKPVLNDDNTHFITNYNDFTSILKVGNKLFSVAQFESQPGGMYLSELRQDSKTGKLAVKSSKALNLSAINGIWNPCAGIVTPWETHLGSEEYEPDAKTNLAGTGAGLKNMAKFFDGGTTAGGDLSKANPYFWGFPVEVGVTSTNVMNETNGYAVQKHYSMGRFAHELSYVMPDKKTVYQSDDGTNVGLYMYVAKAPGMLSSGKLYAAKWNQTSAVSNKDDINADISWIALGEATDDEIKGLIDSGIAFADIFDTAAPTAGSCPADYKSVNANGIGLECLKLKTGKEKAAAFLETRRYAAYLGATTEFRKEEGISFDPDGKKLYVSYSEVDQGMEDGKKNGVLQDLTVASSYDAGTGNHIKANFNYCGAVYGYDVASDSSIGSDYVLKKASNVIAGIMTKAKDAAGVNASTIDAYPAGSPYYAMIPEGGSAPATAKSTCSQDGIANPDNLTFIKGQKTLLIGEDTTDGHQNDMVWSYNIETKALTRIFTTPYGAETTSLYNYPDINGFGYIMAVIQHPYTESDSPLASASSSDRQSYAGVIGATPVLTRK